MKKSIIAVVVMAFVSTPAFASEQANAMQSEVVKATVSAQTGEVDSLRSEVSAAKAKVQSLIQKMSAPLPEKTYQDWANEVTKPAIDLMKSRTGLPPKPAVKNQYGGYDKEAWLTQKQEEEFLNSSEFKTTTEQTGKEYGAFLTELNAAIAKIETSALNIDSLNKQTIDSIKLPVLRKLSDKERSFMITSEIELWDNVNDKFVNVYIRPQLARLSDLLELNAEAKVFESLSDKLAQKERAAIQKIEQSTETLNKQTDQILASSGLKKDETGAVIFAPKIDVKMPKIKDFMANCYLLDDGNVNHEESSDKPKPVVETKETIR